MTKRPLSQETDEVPNKRPRKHSLDITSVLPTVGVMASTATLRRPKRPRNASLDTSEDEQGKAKKLKIDRDHDRQTRTPSPWPVTQCQAEQPIYSMKTAQRAYRRKRIRQALERSLEHAFAEQEQYIIFRKQNRLPSPACSKQSVVSDADEFGNTPAMLGLEDTDDIRIEEVFGSNYVQTRRIRNRTARRKEQHSPQIPEVHQTTPLTKQRARNKTSRKKAERLAPNESQRRTRQHRHGHIFYELDPRGKARALQGSPN